MSNESKTEDVAEFAAEKADSTTADAEAAQATQQTKKRRRRWGCCAAGCSLPIVLVLMLIVVVLSWQTSWKSKTRSLEAEIRNRGEPLTVAEADAYFASDRVDGDQVEKFFVAAKQIQKTSTYTKFGRRENGEMVGVEGELIPSDGFADEAFQAEVNSLEAAAIDMKAPVLGGAYPNYSDVLSTRWDAVLTAVWAMRMELLAAQQAGDEQREYEAIRAMFGASEVLAKEPNSESQAIRAASRVVAERAIRDALSNANWSDEQLLQLINDCQQPDWRDSLERTMIGERVAYLDAFDEPTQFEDWRMELVRNIGHYEDRGVYLAYMTYAVESTKQPLPDVLDAMAGFYGEMERQASQSYGLLISAVIARPFEQLRIRVSDAAISDQATAALLAIERYRTKHGGPPDSLKALHPEFLPKLPIDPNNGELLRLLITDDEIIVYGSKDSYHLEIEQAFPAEFIERRGYRLPRKRIAVDNTQ